MEIRNATIRELHDALEAKRVSSVELTREYLAAIEADTLNAFISVAEDALEAAERADAIRSTGKPTYLTGIPIAIKDVLVTKGTVTTAASKMLANYRPPYTATAVQRLLDAGMVSLGKTNCDEFAMGSSNENSAYGPVKNPHDPTRVAGGSSGGSAAAVAAGLAPAALGTDTGGSVRLPASFCGVIGLKPTYGRVSRFGLMAMASSLDQVGIFSRTAEDAAHLLQVMAGYDPQDATSSRVPVPDYVGGSADERQIVIGIPREFGQGLSDVAREWFEAACKRYATIPHVSFKEISLPHIQEALAVYYIVMPSEVSANMARYDGLRYGLQTDAADLESLYAENRSEGFGPEVTRRIMLGTYALSAGYYDAYYAKAAKVREVLRRDFVKAFEQVDCIMGPTSPTPAFRIGEKQSDPLTMYLSDIYTVAANLVGIPAISFPSGTLDGLPMGMQCMGPLWSEEMLFSLVRRALERSA